MRLLLLADLHGNMVALSAMETVIQQLKPDKILFLGDAVGKGPQSRETLDWVRERCSTVIGGNWDFGVGHMKYPNDAYYWRQLGPERLSYLRSLPMEAEVTLSGLRLRLLHGRPITGLLRVQTEKELLEPLFHTPSGDFDGVIFADSHRPFFRTLDCGYIMNTGSVGNSMGVPRAHALMLEGGDNGVLLSTILSVPYDNRLAANLAQQDPDLPRGEAYIREILTGIYSR